MNLSQTFAEMEARRAMPKPRQHINDTIAAFYVAITTMIMAYGSLFGAYPILLLYAIWLPKFRPFTLSKDTLILLPLPLLAVASALWSDYPLDSIYYALEYASLILCTIIISETVSTRAFMRGIIIGCTIVLAIALVSNHYGGDGFSGNDALMGYFGSKNMVGLFAEIGLLFSLLQLFAAPKKILLLLIPLSISAISLYLSKSASSVLSLALTLAVMTLLYLITKSPRSYRLFMLIGSILIIAALAFAAWSADWQQFLFKSVGKESTLTGRTALWERGIHIGMEKPLLGHGYSAFWIAGNPRAEQIWFDHGVLNKTGFHFHNLYIELFVELGIAGVAIMIAFLLINVSKCIGSALHRGINITSALPLAIALMFVIRSLVEVDLIGTFNIGTVLCYSIIPRLAGSKTAVPPLIPAAGKMR